MSSTTSASIDFYPSCSSFGSCRPQHPPIPQLPSDPADPKPPHLSTYLAAPAPRRDSGNPKHPQLPKHNRDPKFPEDPADPEHPKDTIDPGRPQLPTHPADCQILNILSLLQILSFLGIAHILHILCFLTHLAGPELPIKPKYPAHPTEFPGDGKPHAPGVQHLLSIFLQLAIGWRRGPLAGHCHMDLAWIATTLMTCLDSNTAERPGQPSDVGNSFSSCNTCKISSRPYHCQRSNSEA